MRTFSIIVVAYNETKFLARFKDSLDRQRIPAGWRVEPVLVDNGSTDGTVNAAIHMGFIKIVARPGTIAACRNAGFQASTGEIISYVDADCEVTSDWIEGVIAYTAGRDCIVGWPVEPPWPATWVQSAWHAHWTHKRGHVASALVGKDAMTLITTANMSMPRQVMEKLGGFDESMRAGEDMNFLLRAYHEDIDLIAAPDLRVIHHGEPRSLRAFFRQQQWHCSKNSFFKILRTSAGLRGGNAVWYTVLFTGTLLVGVLGLFLAAFEQYWTAASWSLPWLLLVIAPAIVIAWRAKKSELIWQLPILYFVYGWVRMWDWFGAGRRRRSWRLF